MFIEHFLQLGRITFSILIIVFMISGIHTTSLNAEESVIPQQVIDWQVAATTYEKSGDLYEAQAEYEKIIQSYPHTSYGFDACVKSGGLYIKQKQFTNIQPLVIQICTNFQEQPGIFKALSNLTKDCMYAGAYPEAIAICTDAQTHLSLHPRSTLITGWLGMVYAHQGNFEGAAQMRQALLKKEDCIASDFLDAMCDIGWGYQCRGRFNRAVETFQLGLERYSDHPNAVYLQYQIAKTYIAKDDPNTADMEIKTLLTQYAHRDKTPGLAFRLANEYYKKGQYLEAIGVYEHLLSQYGDHELVPDIKGMEIKSYTMLAKEYRQKKKTDRAVAAYEAIIERFDDDEQIPSIRDAIVETYADAGDLVNARKALQTDIETCPHRRELLRMITRVAVETARIGDTEAAMNLVDAIFDQSPVGSDQLLFGYTTLARVYVHQGNDSQAEATVNEALDLFQNSPDDLAYHLYGVGEEFYLQGQNEARAGNTQKAQSDFEKALSYWSNTVDRIADSRHKCTWYLGIGSCYRELENYQRAADAFQKAYQINPNYRYADYCLFENVRCYGKLARMGAVSRCEAFYCSYLFLDELVEQFPESKYRPYAVNWLSQCLEE